MRSLSGLSLAERRSGDAGKVRRLPEQVWREPVSRGHEHDVCAIRRPDRPGVRAGVRGQLCERLSLADPRSRCRFPDRGCPVPLASHPATGVESAYERPGTAAIRCSRPLRSTQTSDRATLATASSPARHEDESTSAETRQTARRLQFNVLTCSRTGTGSLDTVSRSGSKRTARKLPADAYTRYPCPRRFRGSRRE